MRVLIVTHHYLHGNGGGVFASRGFINACARLYDDVTLMCPVLPGHSPEHIVPSVRIINVPDPRSFLRKFLDLATGRLHRFGRVFPELLSRERFDLVVFDTSYPSGDLALTAKAAGTLVVTIHHNCQYEYERDNATGLTRPLMLFWMPRCERRALYCSDLNITLTEFFKSLRIFS